MLSDEQLLLALFEDETRRRRKRKWIHNINRKRIEFGEYHTLMPELRKDVNRFFIYFRMLPKNFL
nr:unnamed protein product [Callosobruchus chinensis]